MLLPCRPAIDEIIMIEPLFIFTISGSISLHSQKLLCTFDFIIFSNASSGMLLDGPKYGFTAALHTKVVILPQNSFDLTYKFFNCSLSEILHDIAVAVSLPNVLLISSATFSHASILRLVIITLAPCSAIRYAIALPMPREDPVIIAFLSFKLKSDVI